MPFRTPRTYPGSWTGRKRPAQSGTPSKWQNRGICLTPPTPRCSVWGHGRGLSKDVAGVGAQTVSWFPLNSPTGADRVLKYLRIWGTTMATTYASDAATNENSLRKWKNRSSSGSYPWRRKAAWAAPSIGRATHDCIVRRAEHSSGRKSTPTSTRIWSTCMTTSRSSSSGTTTRRCGPRVSRITAAAARGWQNQRMPVVAISTIASIRRNARSCFSRPRGARGVWREGARPGRRS